ncbi:TCP-1/cpn60 chaperonin family protein [Halomicrococcus sp. NG-SE-24]|uniref:TCP-1/cpn60 chaperonin family protein n=1 Tax=Halomicrococcus sp. NG-SE-24 TaxID=3436928 RepID=UPI003D9657E4
MGGREVGRSQSEPAPQFPQANITAVRAIAEILRTTLGPTPQDTLVLSQLETRSGDADRGIPGTDEYVVASDGATVLEELPLEHPIAPVLLRVVGPERPGDTDVEGERIPDGITTTVVLGAALLKEAATLLEKGLHPTTVSMGYETALAVVADVLDGATRSLSAFPSSTAAASAVARTAMTGNDVGAFADDWAPLAVEAVETVGTPDETTFAVRRFSNGRIDESRLVHGAVLDRYSRAHPEMEREKRDATVLALGGQDNRGLQVWEPESIAGVRVDSVATEAALADAEHARRREVVDHLVELGVDVVVTRSGIDRHYLRLLVDAGVLGVRGVTSLDFSHVCRGTGATEILKPDDATAADLGHAGVVEEQRIGRRRHRRKRRRILVFDECDAPETVTAVLTGVSGQPGDQMARQVRKAAAAVAAARGLGGRRPGVVPGGGATELRIARTLRTTARSTDTREQLAIEAYADAVDRVVTTLARNGGRDPVTTLADLRAAHETRSERVGLVLPDGTIEDTVDAGVLDPIAYRRKQYVCATEVSQLLLTIDDAIDAERADEGASPGEALYDTPGSRRTDSTDG